MKSFMESAENFPRQDVSPVDLRDYQTQVGRVMQRLLIDVARMQPESGQTETEQLLIQRFHDIIKALRQLNIPLGYVGR